MKKNIKIFNFIRTDVICPYIVGLVVAIIVALGIGFAPGTRDEIATVVVNRGSTVSSVANRLYDDNIILSRNFFKVAVKLFGGNVHIGTYEIPSDAGAWQIAKMMTKGDVATTIFMIPEGYTVKQIIAALDANPDLSGTACLVMCPDDGELFPDTYRVARGESRGEVINLMRKKMIDMRESMNDAELPAPLADWNEVITLASIVQKETPQVAEMPIAASVYLNRLRIGMRLQADPTVVYAVTDKLGDMEGRALLRSHLQTAHPFNTYVNYGLPPGPIANVGRAAIEAVLNPAKTDFLYFVADGTGGHKFSKTYAEHQQRHNEWREIRSNQ